MAENIKKITINGTDYTLSASTTKNTYSYKTKELIQSIDNGFDIDGSDLKDGEEKILAEKLATKNFADKNLYNYKQINGNVANFFFGTTTREIKNPDGTSNLGMRLEGGGRFQYGLPDTSMCTSFTSLRAALPDEFEVFHIPWWDCDCFTNCKEFAEIIDDNTISPDAAFDILIEKGSVWEWKMFDETSNTQYEDLSETKRDLYTTSFVNQTGLVNTIFFSSADPIPLSWEQFAIDAHYCIIYLDTDIGPKCFAFIAPEKLQSKFHQYAVLISDDYTFNDIYVRRM